MPSRQVWGKVGELMKTQITNFRNLPMNVIFTALSRTRISGEEGDDEEISYGPACSPSIAGHLEAAVDVIGHLTTREIHVKKKEGEKVERIKVIRRRMLVGPHAQYMTKDRHGLFGEYIDNPNLTKIFKQIQEGNSNGT
jgi:AAA domain